MQRHQICKYKNKRQDRRLASSEAWTCLPIRQSTEAEEEEHCHSQSHRSTRPSHLRGRRKWNQNIARAGMLKCILVVPSCSQSELHGAAKSVIHQSRVPLRLSAAGHGMATDRQRAEGINARLVPGPPELTLDRPAALMLSRNDQQTRYRSSALHSDISLPVFSAVY